VEPAARTSATEMLGLSLVSVLMRTLFMMLVAAETPTVPPMNWKTCDY
jgi:hypothetical protein